MNKFGVHALVWSGTWDAKQCEYAISSTKEAGYDIIELPAFSPAEMDIGAIQRALEAHDVEVTCSLGLGFENDINSEDAGCVARGEQTLNDALSMARDIGAKYLGGVIFSALGPYTTMPTQKCRENSQAVIGRLADTAKASGITVGLEFVNRYETNLLNTSAQTVEYIKEVGSDNLVVHLDSYHMNIEENNFRDPVFDAGDLLGYVHIGENHRGYLGQGHVNFPELFQALVDAEYDGVITFESFSSKVVDENLSTILRIWRNMWDNSMDLAVQARRYMGEEMAKAIASKGA
ncbi:MAG TPA: sugar phosphate isomerase/epimerase [Anaerolineae bacterium]|nr:sugar phosphate isomerase/epimerase [Anaerolineae bacterium]